MLSFFSEHAPLLLKIEISACGPLSCLSNQCSWCSKHNKLLWLQYAGHCILKSLHQQYYIFAWKWSGNKCFGHIYCIIYFCQPVSDVLQNNISNWLCHNSICRVNLHRYCNIHLSSPPSMTTSSGELSHWQYFCVTLFMAVFLLKLVIVHERKFVIECAWHTHKKKKLILSCLDVI